MQISKSVDETCSVSDMAQVVFRGLTPAGDPPVAAAGAVQEYGVAVLQRCSDVAGYRCSADAFETSLASRSSPSISWLVAGEDA